MGEPSCVCIVNLIMAWSPRSPFAAVSRGTRSTYSCQPCRRVAIHAGSPQGSHSVDAVEIDARIPRSDPWRAGIRRHVGSSPRSSASRPDGHIDTPGSWRGPGGGAAVDAHAGRRWRVDIHGGRCREWRARRRSGRGRRRRTTSTFRRSARERFLLVGTRTGDRRCRTARRARPTRDGRIAAFAATAEQEQSPDDR
jgi:hypothetical protein